MNDCAFVVVCWMGTTTEGEPSAILGPYTRDEAQRMQDRLRVVNRLHKVNSQAPLWTLELDGITYGPSR